jgi:hypothetical protein
MASSVTNEFFFYFFSVISPPPPSGHETGDYFFEVVLELVFQVQEQGEMEELLTAMLGAARNVASYVSRLELITFAAEP